MHYSKFFFFFLFVLILHSGRAQDIAPDFLRHKDAPWVDSVFSTLSPKERLAQLFMVAAYSNRDSLYEAGLAERVAANGIGGVIFFQGGPVRQAMLTNRLQAATKVPLLVAMDAEWGLKMRLDSTTRFPYAMALGAIQDPHLLYETGAAVARHCKRLGVHINFAPVLDINNNPMNPVISFRSFGENKNEVTWRGFEFAKGMEDNNVMAVGKHFPGHGDTNIDSHLDLPLIPHTRERLDSIELFPFRFAIENGFSGIMVAHLNVPALDSTGLPTTLSPKVVTGLLKEKLGFRGLIFTDALNMEGVAKYCQPGEVDLFAFKAGNDVMLFSGDVPKAIELIMNAVERGEIDQKEIDERCRKILAAKYWAGLHAYKPVKLENLVKDINSPQDALLNMQLAEASLTVLGKENDAIPIRKLSGLKVATLAVGSHQTTLFQENLQKYVAADHFYYGILGQENSAQELLGDLEKYDLVIAGVHDLEVYPRNNFGITAEEALLLKEIANSGKGIITLFGNPYALQYLEDMDSAEALVVAYQETKYTQSLAAQLIFGAVKAEGKLPVSVNDHFTAGSGKKTLITGRFKYTVPEEVGIDSRVLHQIDSLAKQAIREGATPGCQVLAAKSGKVIWQKSYGFHTYDSLVPVKNTDIFDLASITKVASATTALMKLYEEGKFDLDARLSDYLPYFKRGDKSDLKFRELLAHQAGLKAWIPFWKNTIRKNGKFKWFTFKEDSSKRFPIKVADNLYLHRKYKKKMYKAIRKSELGPKEYVYSDLSFYLYPEIVERLSGVPFAQYMQENFYKPLGANSFCFNPYSKFPSYRIVPTEFDSVFRKQLLWGRVHDEGSAMMGGLSGHAGLFATANDLAKLAQMWCNFGVYGGKRYLKEETIKEFTRCQFCKENGNRRALGFDRPLETPRVTGNTAVSVSQASFGHSGFTGTLVWADPKYDIVYIFLSNRVYPTRENKKLFNLNTRTNIQQVIYEGIKFDE